MANALYCQDNLTENINFSGQTFAIGDFITATDNAPSSNVVNYCFEITDNVSSSGTFTATTEIFSSCFDCLSNNFTIVNADFCDGSGSLKIDISGFGFIPTENQIFNIQLSLGTEISLACIQIISVEQVSEDDYNILTDLYSVDKIIFNNYSSCDECLFGFSAGTESVSCNICWDGTGYTSTVVTAPHPKWTNLQGQTVILLDAIQLGGMNGLNN